MKKMIGKRSVVGIFLLTLVVASVFVAGVSFVSAGPLEDVYSFVGERGTVFANYVSDEGNTATVVRFLFFILVFLIVMAVVSRIPLFSRRKTTSVLVALIVSVLAVFFIPVDLIYPLLNPYSALGVALISVLPFILIFLFAQHFVENRFIRHLIWFFFAVGLLLMTIYTSLLQGSDPATYGNPLFGWVYGIASVLALSMAFWGDWIDKHTFLGKMEAEMTDAQRRMRKRHAVDKLKEEEYEGYTDGAGI